MYRRLLAFALALTGGAYSQTLSITHPTGGAFRSLAASTDRVLAANSKLFEVRSAALTELPGISASLAANGLAIATVKTSADDSDIRITAIDSNKSITIGGRGNDIPTRAFATRDAFYILGNTDSPDFPVTNATRARGSGFLLKLDAELNTVYATYLGGAGQDDFSDIAVDASGSAFVVAASNSAELASGAKGSPAYIRNGLGFDIAGSGSFRATVQAWLAPNDNTLYAATAGQGLFRTSDQGQSWAALNLTDLNVTALAGDSQTIYAGTPRALHRSTNGGTSWSEAPVSSSGSGIRALAAVPRDRNIVYAALLNGCGLFRSADAARTWQTQLSDVCVSALAVNDTAVFAFSPNNGVYRSTTTGGAWTRVSTTLLNTRAASFDGATLYAATNTGLSKSVDNGQTWAEIFTGSTITCLSGSTIGTSDQGILQDGVRIDDAAIQQPVRSILVTNNLIVAGTDYLPDLYVAKVAPRGDQILFSTFLGGLGNESSPRIALDNTGGIIVGATTDSADLIATFEGVQRRYAGGISDLFLAKLNANFDLTTLTYFGGSARDTLGGIAVDSRSFVHIVGTTASPDLPVSNGASRTGLDGAPTAGFLAVLSPGLGSMSHLTYTGRGAASGEAIAVQGDHIWISGGQGDEEGYVACYTGLVNFGAITAIRNGASLATGPVAPSLNVIIEGSGFGASLFGLTVRFGQSEASVIRTSDTRLEVVTPADLEPGTNVPVSVTSRTGSFQGSASVAAISPGVFTANRDGKGVAQALLIRLDTDDVTTTVPVYECDINDVCTALPIDLGDEGDQLSLILRATGIRGRRESITVDMNGTAAEVLSANALDEFSGVDQIVVKLPRTLAGEITIRVIVDGQAANPVTIRIG